MTRFSSPQSIGRQCLRGSPDQSPPGGKTRAITSSRGPNHSPTPTWHVPGRGLLSDRARVLSRNPRCTTPSLTAQTVTTSLAPDFCFSLLFREQRRRAVKAAKIDKPFQRGLRFREEPGAAGEPSVPCIHWPQFGARPGLFDGAYSVEIQLSQPKQAPWQRSIRPLSGRARRDGFADRDASCRLS
jgi:hypothetical protein